jgi:hypothetical protein
MNGIRYDWLAIWAGAALACTAHVAKNSCFADYGCGGTRGWTAIRIRMKYRSSAEAEQRYKRRLYSTEQDKIFGSISRRLTFPLDCNGMVRIKADKIMEARYRT